MGKSDAKTTDTTPALLTTNKARESLKKLDGWQSSGDYKMIYRDFILHNFMAAVDLIDQIAAIAEDEKHHPDIHLTQYRNLRIGLTTHDVGGLSNKDFAVALKINDVPLNKERQHSQPKHTAKVNLETKKQSKKNKG